jgi:hypothetical protein
LVAALLAEQGIETQPSLESAQPDEWITLTLPILPPQREYRVAARPSDELFAHLESVPLDSEREVEMHFASPLFRALGYGQENEAAGFRFDLWEGVHHRLVEADLLYFADSRHNLDGDPLVLVECKMPGSARDAGLGQAKSYAYWIKPAYYVTVSGDYLVAYNYQGGAVPDVKVFDAPRDQLRGRFDELYGLLSLEAASAAREVKLAKLKRPEDHGPDAVLS